MVKSYINKNYHNTTTNSNIDVKLRLLSKLERKNTVVSKKVGGDVMLVNYGAFMIFLIYGQFAAIEILD